MRPVDFPVPGQRWSGGRSRGLIFGLLLALLTTFASAAAKDEGWLRVVTPEFTLVTTLGQKEASAWAGEFSQYVGELRRLFSVSPKLTPLTIVVFSREKSFDEFRPLDEKGKPLPLAGYFLRHNSWAVAGLSGATATTDIRHTIFHEGVHWFLSGQEKESPVWIGEGMAEVLSTFELTKKTVEWGHALPEHVDLLREERMLTTEQLLALGRNELFRDSSNHTGIVYAQSWITVHFLLFGDNPKISRSSLFDFIKLTNGGMPVEAAFRQAVGCDFTTFDRYLKEYLRSGSYFIYRRPLEARPTFRAEPAPAVEVAQALGRLALAGRHWDKAIGFARDSIAAAPDDPRGFEMLGLAQSEKGEDAAALKSFAQAADKGSTDFQTYFALAAGAHHAASADGAAGLTPAQARTIADQYEHAISLSPRFLASYQNLAGILPALETKPGDREFLELGLRLFPRDAIIRIGLAVLQEKAGDRTGALAVVDEIEADKNEASHVRKYARELSSDWTGRQIMERLGTLTRQKKFSEALAYLEERLGGPLSPSLRAQLAGMRSELRTDLQSQEIGRALAEERWEDARRLLTATLEMTGIPPTLRRQAQQTLDELNRRVPLRNAAKP